jgi:ankyrin repeat protein
MGVRERAVAALASIALFVAPAAAGPLHDAARSGDLAQLKTLLDSGANIEDRDGTKETPLISAALAGQAEIVAELIKRGADLMARNNRGLTPLHAAAYDGSLAAVTLLVEAGAAVNDGDDKFKVTPLILASEENHPDVVTFLAEQGADLEQRERHGYTALTRAGFKERWEAIQALIKAGARCQSAKVAGDSWAMGCAKQVILEITDRTGGLP